MKTAGVSKKTRVEKDGRSWSGRFHQLPSKSSSRMSLAVGTTGLEAKLSSGKFPLTRYFSFSSFNLSLSISTSINKSCNCLFHPPFLPFEELCLISCHRKVPSFFLFRLFFSYSIWVFQLDLNVLDRLKTRINLDSCLPLRSFYNRIWSEAKFILPPFVNGA